ncbi:Phosphoethanolamine--lipid A transferase EptA C-terminal domain protein [Candidatus Hepatincolaceae symbiont of Richtersius coronifer]
MLYNFKDLIKENLNNNTFIVLHQSGSHGPSYYTKYPTNFEKFTPVCQSVELQNCSIISLINAYDNTILYTDNFLTKIITTLKDFTNVRFVMIYISDHGESLGEYNTYLHGLPNAIAPEVQSQIPFLVWMSDDFIKHNKINKDTFIKNTSYSQFNIFYSVMGAFGLKSEFYNKKLDIFNE